jgi:hypothetical protein
MALTPRKTYPELTALTTPVAGTDVLAAYRAPGPLKRFFASDMRSYVQSFEQDSVDAVETTLEAKMRADVPLDIRLDFGAVGDGVTDDGPAFQKAVDFGNGRPIIVPSGYTFAIKTTVHVDDVPLIDEDPEPPAVPGAFAPGLWLVGDGMALSVIRPMVPNGFAFDVDVTNPDPYAYRAQQGLLVENIAFVGSGSVANSSVFKFRNVYQSRISQCHIRGMTGSAIVMVNGDYPDDGWNMMAFESLWIESCQGWGIDATGSASRNEGSFTHMKHVFIQGCGKNEYFHITGISNASPAVVTVSPLQIPTVTPERSAHIFVPGDRVKLWGINSTVTLGADPITTVAGSAAVTIADTAHGFVEGDNIFFAGADPVGGITVAGAYQVAAVPTANTFMILHSSAASGSATGGGAAVTLRAPMTGLNELDRYVGPSPTATTFSLYQASGSVVSLGTDPFATTSGSATVTVTATAHGLSVGNLVVFSDATAVGGLTIDKMYAVVATPTVNTFTITAASNATSTATGGGSTIRMQLVVAVDSTSYGTLYNPLSPVTINADPFATTAGSAVVTVTDTAYGAAGTDTVTFLPRALGNNPLSTTNGSPTVTVTLTAHGLAVSDQVSIASATDTGGLTINGAYTVVSTPTADTFTITDDTNATSTTTGGGANATLVEMVGGLAISGEYRVVPIVVDDVVNPNSYTITHSSAATSTATGGGAVVQATYYKQLGVSVPEVGYYEPQSGGMRWKGQLLHQDQCGLTVNQNCAFFVKGQSGLGIGVLTHAVTWENNYRRHVFCTGITNWRSEVCQFHGNQSYKTWAGVDFDAQDYTIRGVQWVNTKVRARLGEGFAFRLAGANAAGNSCRVRTTLWDDFDYTGQRRFIGWQFDQVEDDCLLRNAGATAVTFGPPSGFATGNKTVLRMRGPDNSVAGGVASRTGEWVEWRIPNTGVTLLNSSLDDEGAAITANTLYNIYLYDDDGTPKIVASTVAETIDTTHGYMVKTTNSSKRWIGRIKTESASTDFIQTSTQFLVPLTLSGSQLGVGEHFWWDPTNGGRYWQKSGTLPTTTSGGTVALRPALEFNTTTDLGSIAAGASTEFTITATDVATQDAVVAVSSSANNSLMLTGRVSSAGTVTVTAFNPTAGPIDPVNATYRAFVIRR